MTDRIFRVDLVKDTMVFSAAHFITFNGNICEPLHGHNYGVRCEVEGPLDENGYVCDFIALRDTLAKQVAELDHRVVLPTRHPMISVVEEGDEVTARFEERRWVFPKQDCKLLPIANTTAELLASYLADQLVDVMREGFGQTITRLRLGVDENRGQWGEVVIDLGPR